LSKHSASLDGSGAAKLRELRDGQLAAFIDDGPALEIGSDDRVNGRDDVAPGSLTTVLAYHRLQDMIDYRAALQRWFGAVRIGGRLVVVVPHAFLYERRVTLPARLDPAQRRLYTPRVLLDEVEEALAPNSYRVRFLSDRDDGYDYARADNGEPDGLSDIVVVLEKLAPPAWQLDMVPAARADRPDYTFEPSRTRVEVTARRPRSRILVLKLDHLGDFIMGIGPLQKMRADFAGSEITLVVGSWNLQMARELGVADHVVPFDAFPRNSSEEEVDVPGKTEIFKAAVPDEYDLAIDLRTDHDTRFLLRHVKAAVRAGIGLRAQFPFLDIFLPLDFNRNEPETAREYQINHHAFASQGNVLRGEYRMAASAEEIGHNSAVVWGPYHSLRPGRYFFEPYIEFGSDIGDGLLMIDIGLNAVRVTSRMVPGGDPDQKHRLSFEVGPEGGVFEFRVWPVQGMPGVDFSFYGGRLVREGAASVLHQSEYLCLLIELVAMRLDRIGLLVDEAAA
jgi:hypothetical protein